MELTATQRADVAAIRDAAVAEATHSYTRHARPPGGREAFKAWGRKLDALGAAWADLDHDTQMHLLVKIVTQWTDDDSEVVPDLSLIAHDLKKGLALPQHAEERQPGLMAATKYLWRVWVIDKPEPINMSAGAKFISSELAPLFGVTESTISKRVESILRDWAKGEGELRVTDMPGTGSGRTYNTSGARVS